MPKKASYTGKELRPMNLRVPSAVRQVIEMAARAQGESLTTYMLRAALGRARAILHSEVGLLDKAEDQMRNHGLRY